MIHDTWSTIVFVYPIFGRNQLQRFFSVQWIPFRMNRTLKLLSWRGWASDRFCGSSTDYWWFDQLKSKYVMLVVKWVVKWVLDDKLLWNGLFFLPVILHYFHLFPVATDEFRQKGHQQLAAAVAAGVGRCAGCTASWCAQLRRVQSAWKPRESICNRTCDGCRSFENHP